MEETANDSKVCDKIQKDCKRNHKEPPFSMEQMNSLQAELDSTGIIIETTQSRYKIQKLQTMGEELYGKAMLALSQMKSADAA